MAAALLAALLVSCGSLASPLPNAASIDSAATGKSTPLARGYIMRFLSAGKLQSDEMGNLPACEPSKCKLWILAFTTPPRLQKLQITLYAKRLKAEDWHPSVCVIARETRIVDPSKMPHPFTWKFPNARSCPA